MNQQLGKQLTRPRGAIERPERRILESARIPVRLPPPTRLKSISVSPLIDQESPLSLPESEYNRIRWLNRFTPHWNEPKHERLARFKLRAQKMRTRRAHTEKIFNSFQRLDGFTGTVLPSDLMISFSFQKWTLPRSDSQAPESLQQQQQETRPIDILNHRKKLRTLYRYTHEPKFSPHLSDQISSQLVRRIAQECVVLKETLGVPSSVISSLDDLVLKTRSGKIARIPDDYPTTSSRSVLLTYLKTLIDVLPSQNDDDNQDIKNQADPDPSANLGAILVKSTSLFRELESLQAEKDSKELSIDEEEESRSKVADQSGEDRLMFSILLSDGPVPVWDLEGLLTQMAKQPPRQNSGTTMITAALNNSTNHSSTHETTLADILRREIDEALTYTNHKSSSSTIEEPSAAYLIGISEPTYPLILALRRATWWIGQGYESHHFAGIKEMVNLANQIKSDKELKWINWIRNKNSVDGIIKNNGQLWKSFNPKSDTSKKIWRRKDC
ncbi:hypothetical protein Pst134EA_001016 [Puccinia striiformis f. sp. tritici]|uniref:hypothetical protein n=1 Tax=Puccinia striiformis f. sp. tritici TaxID=168172 RepID=UPI002007C2F1|nr:hypothetical protein Pst134EA_001016 [Puccinia striiformis f. sp. tritici]KAH9473961.1 hypothetical protein Pst134EA_001016 [Puccinia striiformis f. sp. tritici]